MKPVGLHHKLLFRVIEHWGNIVLFRKEQGQPLFFDFLSWDVAGYDGIWYKEDMDLLSMIAILP